MKKIMSALCVFIAAASIARAGSWEVKDAAVFRTNLYVAGCLVSSNGALMKGLTTLDSAASLGTITAAGNISCGGRYIGDGSLLTGIVSPASVTNNQTNVNLGGTFSGVHSGSGTGLTLNASVVTNNATGITLGGAFSGEIKYISGLATSDQALTNIPITGISGSAVSDGYAYWTSINSGYLYWYGPSVRFSNVFISGRSIIVTSSLPQIGTTYNIHIYSGGGAIYLTNWSYGGIQMPASGSTYETNAILTATNNDPLVMWCYLATSYEQAHIDINVSTIVTNNIGIPWVSNGVLRVSGY